MSLRRHSFRAYPTVGQCQDLARLFGAVRAVFNEVVAFRRADFEAGLPYSSRQVVSNFVTVWAKRHHMPWLAEVSSVPLQQAVADAERAYGNFFDSLNGKRRGRKVGQPRFKTKHDHRQSARFTRNSRFKVDHPTDPGQRWGRVMLPKVGWVRYRASRPLPSDPSSVTVTRQPDGTFEVSFVVDVPDLPAVTPVHPGRVAGLDLGLTDFAAIAYSDGTRAKVANPRHLKAAQRRLVRAQRALSRKQVQSANRAKARVRVARQHAKVAAARKDFHHKLALDLVRENQTVCVEGLNVVGMSRSMGRNAQGRGFRRSVHDAGWGQFLTILADKAGRHGRDLRVVDPAGTSQTCSVCGSADGRKGLEVRQWACDGCGAVLDRDWNAAVNILNLGVSAAAGNSKEVMVAAGQVETVNACGVDVRRTLASASDAVDGEARTLRTSLDAAA